jgi:EAL domain-containing protein (putative c-di-GMP-specific phosphodiesterase class I)
VRVELLSVVFQPVVRLATGEVIGWEALGRGPEGPLQLLDRAHAEGKLAELDLVFQQLAVAGAVGLDGRVLFVNIDTRIISEQVDAHERARFLVELAAQAGLQPGQLAVELGERGPSLPEIGGLAAAYRAAGFRIALDDVGAGYASLSAVVHARPEIMKLDISLVRGVADDPLRLQLVRALASFSNEAGVPLVAEGIETFEDVRALLNCGIELGQGFGLARPASALEHPTEEVRARLRDLASRRAGATPFKTAAVRR